MIPDIISIIEKKKLGHALTQEEIAFFADGAAHGTIGAVLRNRNFGFASIGSLM